MTGQVVAQERTEARERPRKEPRQERSRQLVRELLDAAAALLAERGYDALTTRRVAERAGVSVGSLYQYFPSKESLVHALLVEHLREAAALRPPALARPDLPLAERVRWVVRWFLAAHAKAPALHRGLTEAAPIVFGVERVRAMERSFHRTVLEALRPYAAEIAREDLELSAFVFAQCLESLTHGTVVHHPDQLAGARLEDEITELLLGYLRRAPTGRDA
jgi:AcrR family transcriptional regulator